MQSIEIVNKSEENDIKPAVAEAEDNKAVEE